jgi:hypothetical protein
LKDGRGAVLNNPDGSALHAPVTLEYVNATGATVDSAPATTNDSGTAGFPANAIPSTVTGVYASFAGSTNYQPSTSSSLRPTWPTTITITDDTGGSANYAAPVSFTVTVNVPTGLGGSAPTGTVTLFVDGQNAKTLPLSSGSAVFKTTTLPPLQDDKTAHAITATYSGDATFKPSTNSNTVNHIVVCGKQRYTGTYAASLSFTKALTYCLYNATVNGSLTVSGGANVAIVNAKLVGGTINANGAAQVMLCGSNAGGGLSVTNSTGAVVVGDPSALCAADTSSGSFNFQYDPNGVRAIGYTASNTVCKSVGGRNVPWPTDVSSISGCSI